MKKEKLISKYDLLLIVAILLIAAILGHRGSHRGRSFCHLENIGDKSYVSNGTVTITLEGETYGEYPLGENREIEIIQEDASNLVEIKDGMVRMKEANCPDLYCVKHKAIQAGDEVIVCLPHKLVVEIR